jgi:hypothetical protein
LVFLLRTPTFIQKPYEIEELKRILRTKREQLDVDHIMINFIFGTHCTQLR